jgi:hypothetical protein
MTPGQLSSLLMPAFLHGSYSAVQRKTRVEGHRCGEQYRKDGSFAAPDQLLEVPRGEVVVTHEVADFQHERPAWRLYMLSSVMSGLYESLDWQNALHVRDAYEAFSRETAWGALYFAISQTAPKSAARTALRLQAVLRFWEPLQSARYLFKLRNAVLTLEELMSAACDWAMDAWSPVGEASVRARLENAAGRMRRATREDSTEAILRQMPFVLTHAHDLKHRDALADPAFVRARLAMLDSQAFERVSGAWTSELLGQLYDWDRELEKH